MNHRVVFTGIRQVDIEECDTPAPGPGQVLIRTIKTAVSTGTELTILTGDYPHDSKWSNFATLPFNAGYSNVGEVVEIGDQVSRFRVGDRVASSANHCTYAVVADGPSTHHVPDAVSDEAAALFMLAQIAINGVRRAALNMGEAVVVYGLGLIGQFALQLARIDGARPAIGVDLSQLRRDFAQAFGADLVIDGADDDIPAQVKAATHGRMADCVIELTGIADLIPREMDLLRRQGRIVILSSPRGQTSFDFHDYCNSPSLTIIGAHNGSHPQCETPYNPWTAARNTEFIFDLIAAGDLHADELVTHRYCWDAAAEAYGMLIEDRGQAGAVILDWHQ
jgi:2-desacetyl-2-hydroxyethyl bacteriochlorophyllide A dehydrogenase